MPPIRFLGAWDQILLIRIVQNGCNTLTTSNFILIGVDFHREIEYRKDIMINARLY